MESRTANTHAVRILSRKLIISESLGKSKQLTEIGRHLLQSHNVGDRATPPKPMVGGGLRGGGSILCLKKKSERDLGIESD